MSYPYEKSWISMTPQCLLSSLGRCQPRTQHAWRCAFAQDEKIAIFTANGKTLAPMRDLIRDECGVDTNLRNPRHFDTIEGRSGGDLTYIPGLRDHLEFVDTI